MDLDDEDKVIIDENNGSINKKDSKIDSRTHQENIKKTRVSWYSMNKGCLINVYSKGKKK